MTEQTTRFVARAGARILGFGFAVALLTIGGLQAASAQQLFQAATSTDMRAVGAAATASDPLRLRSKLVKINRGVLSEQIAPAGSDTATNRADQSAALGGVVQIDLAPGLNLTFSRTSVAAAGDSGVAWAGSASNKDIQEAMLVVSDGAVTGRVQAKNRLFKIEQVSGDVHRITEIDQTKIRPEAAPLVRPGLGGSSGGQDEAQSGPVGPQANTIIKVLAVYTVNARNQAGGTNQIKADINSAIALANQAYTRGGIPITVQLAGTAMQVSYSESGDIGTDLTRLTSGSQFNTVRAQRASRKADLVSLFRKYDATFCGIAWLPGSGTMPMPGPATRETGYSVMVRDCVSNLSFHHEMGHNQGLQHDRFVLPTYSNSFYNFGYVNIPKRQRTVMAYNNACSGVGGCTRINWFSSPTIKATGNVTIGKAQNQSGAADNTRRLKETRTKISQYYN